MNQIIIRSEGSPKVYNPSTEQMELIKEILKETAAKYIDLEDVYRTVGGYFSLGQYLGKSRKRELVYARQLFCYVSRQVSNASLKTIGLFLDRDHTTVIHSSDTIIDLMPNYPYVKQDVVNIMEMLTTKQTA